ncbi:MAG TPA: site-2 protease family protein [Chloroflexota bacterium]|nr:site-2 protease family protein [Chloroflexota bacterium]
MFGLSRLAPVQLLIILVIGFVLFQAPLLQAARDPTAFLGIIIALVVGITVHEASHATVAVALGDPTPRLMGRVSLNPLRHLDPIGSLMMFIASFGWGKPVMFNPNLLRGDPRLGSALVSAAGPVSNILLALLGVLWLVHGADLGRLGDQVLQMIIAINVALAAFNLIPIPPLDGFGFVTNLLPRELAAPLMPLVQYGPIILLALVFLGPALHVDLLGAIMRPIQQAIMHVIVSAARVGA